MTATAASPVVRPSSSREGREVESQVYRPRTAAGSLAFGCGWIDHGFDFVDAVGWKARLLGMLAD